MNLIVESGCLPYKMATISTAITHLQNEWKCQFSFNANNWRRHMRHLRLYY